VTTNLVTAAASAACTRGVLFGHLEADLQHASELVGEVLVTLDKSPAEGGLITSTNIELRTLSRQYHSRFEMGA
jgi:hypothetical protein